MKKIYFLFVLFMHVVLCSCSNETELHLCEEAMTDQSFGQRSEVEASLVSYAENFRDTVSGISETRGWKNFWKAVKSDFQKYEGRGIGLAISVSASRKTYKELELQNLETELSTTPDQARGRSKVTIESVVCLRDSFLTAYQLDTLNIGSLHNAIILDNIIHKEMNDSSIQSIVASTNLAMSRLGLVDRPYQLRDIENSLQNYFSSNVVNTDNYYQDLSVKNSEMSDVYAILNYYLTSAGSYTSVNRIESYTAGYIDIILNSNLTSSKKKFIIETISIAPASYFLWNWYENVVIVDN